MRPLSFQARISLGCICLLLLALLTAFFAIRHSLRAGLQEEATQNAEENLELVEWLIHEHRPFEDMAAFDAWLDALGSRMDARITYIVGGDVIADSEVKYDLLPSLEDHSTRPEVLQAKEEGEGLDIRRSATIKQELMYIARPMAADSGVPAGMLRLAVKLSAMHAQYDRVATPLGWIFLATLGAAMVFALFLSRALTRSIRELSASAAAIGKGDAFKKIRYYPGREFKPLVQSLNTMAENIRITVHDLEEGKKRLETVFDAMSDGVVVLDGSGRIESWNKAALDMHPELATASGRWPLELFGEPELHASITRLMEEKGETESGEIVRYIDKDGRHFDIRLERFAIPDGVRLMLVLRDVTEQRRLEEMRRDFVANVSHELRTPITSIRGYAETLLDMPETAEDDQFASRKQFLSTILRNAEHMQDMVLRLIELSKAEHKLRTDSSVVVNPQAALDQALATLDPLLQGKEVKVVYDTPLSEMPVLAEEGAVENIFRNLLENALKFGPQGQTIDIAATREGNQVRISVRDHGPGVSKEHKDRVFERFYRSAENQTSKEGSAGLGLAICKHLVERFGGTIGLERPEDGDGARFVFTLPAAQKHA